MDTNNSLVCPNCKQLDSVRKVSAIFSEGVSVTSARVEHSQGGYSYGSGVSQSAMSLKLSPPDKPTKVHWLAWILPILLFWGAFYFLKDSITGKATLDQLSNEQLTILGQEDIENFNNQVVIRAIVGIVLGIAGIGIALLIGRKNSHYPIQFEKWQKAKSKWDKLYYCNRCDGVFMQPENRFISIGQVNDYLHKINEQRRRCIVLVSESCSTKNAQQSVHPTCGSLRDLGAFFWLRVFPAPKHCPRPPTRG